MMKDAYTREKDLFMLEYWENTSSNSEASISELLENIEEMFPRYYMDGNVIFNYVLVCHPILKQDLLGGSDMRWSPQDFK